MARERLVYTLQQVSEHRSLNDLWIVIRGKVYDVSSYLDDHPGGKEVLLQVSGGDATEDFDFVGHSEDAKETLFGFEIGLLAGFAHEPPDGQANGMAIAQHTVRTWKNSLRSSSQSWKLAIAVAAVLAGACVLAATFNSRLGGWISSIISFYVINGFFSGVVGALLLCSCTGVVLQRVRRQLFYHKDVFQHVPYFDCKEEFL
ncbi:cytochrome b5-like heme/steroid binding domain-containing protein [Nemania serpens]|nr:cytochrome b5-like heme/steroid binding domain-containing protein [Nemania serpens]